MNVWTLERLKAKTANERHQLWENAKARIGTSADARILVKMIEESGLDYRADRGTPVTLDSAIGRDMRNIILSPEAITAALDAVGRGLPALAGVEPLLIQALGEAYGKDNEATVQAGYLVNGMMEGQGFTKDKQKPMPNGSVARTALTYKRR